MRIRQSRTMRAGLWKLRSWTRLRREDEQLLQLGHDLSRSAVRGTQLAPKKIPDVGLLVPAALFSSLTLHRRRVLEPLWRLGLSLAELVCGSFVATVVLGRSSVVVD
jgi:hypothetical protein